MKFVEYAAEHADKVYNKICEHLPDREPKEHYKMVRDYVDRRGKYKRPAYLLLWTELYGGDLEKAILPAAAMQSSEDWILMHDDWYDQADLRRGKPSAHVLYGSEYAINAGDALHMIQWKIAFNAADQFDPETRKRWLDKFYDMLLVTMEGQYIDMKLTESKDITKFTPEDYYKSIEAKSAYYSVYGPMQMGAIIAGADPETVERIVEYGRPVGRAFQMKDDILDITSDPETFGKSVRNDIREGVKTLILWHAVQNARPNELERLKAVYAKRREDKTDEEVEWVAEKFVEYGSVAHAEQKMNEFMQEALEAFERNTKNIPESPIKETARDSITYVVKRKK